MSGNSNRNPYSMGGYGEDPYAGYGNYQGSRFPNLGVGNSQRLGTRFRPGNNMPGQTPINVNFNANNPTPRMSQPFSGGGGYGGTNMMGRSEGGGGFASGGNNPFNRNGDAMALSGPAPSGWVQPQGYAPGPNGVLGSSTPVEGVPWGGGTGPLSGPADFGPLNSTNYGAGAAGPLAPTTAALLGLPPGSMLPQNNPNGSPEFDLIMRRLAGQR